MKLLMLPRVEPKGVEEHGDRAWRFAWRRSSLSSRTVVRIIKMSMTDIKMSVSGKVARECFERLA
jgi:hypothetical protein